MFDFSLSYIVCKTIAGLILGFSTEETIGSGGTVAVRNRRFLLRLQLIVVMLKHGPGIARYSDFLCDILPASLEN